MPELYVLLGVLARHHSISASHIPPPQVPCVGPHQDETVLPCCICILLLTFLFLQTEKFKVQSSCCGSVAGSSMAIPHRSSQVRIGSALRFSRIKGSAAASHHPAGGTSNHGYSTTKLHYCPANLCSTRRSTPRSLGYIICLLFLLRAVGGG